MSIDAMKQALGALEKLWQIIDDIDTASDMAKDNDVWYRQRVGHLQQTRWQLGITTDGYKLDGGAIAALRAAIEHAERPQTHSEECWRWHHQCAVAKIERRQWQGLTDEEIWVCNAAPAGHHVEFHICVAHQNVPDFAEAIEAKLKEKNT